MITWEQLRAVAAIGTERRGNSIEQDDATSEGSPALGVETKALALAAQFGVARRAGMLPKPMVIESQPDPVGVQRVSGGEQIGPQQVIQTLALLLDPKRVVYHGYPSVVIRICLQQLAQHNMVVPHHLLVPLLKKATGDSSLVLDTAAAVGSHGQWLARQNPSWKSIHKHAGVDVSAVSEMTSEQWVGLATATRESMIRSLRADDPTAGLGVITSIAKSLKAADRDKLVQCLYVGLGPDDEQFLESCLDDRSQLVKDTARRLLDGLPGSARAQRCQLVLDQMVEVSKSKGIRRLYPGNDDIIDETAIRDFGSYSHSQDRKSTSDEQYLVSAIAAAPLAWWESKLQTSADKIVNLVLKESPPETLRLLLLGWKQGALAENNSEWLHILIPAMSRLAKTNRSQFSQLELEGDFSELLDKSYVELVFEALQNTVHMPVPTILLSWPTDYDYLFDDWLQKLKQSNKPNHSVRPISSLISLLSIRRSIIEAFL